MSRSQSNSIFYLLCGLPGSGKTTFCNNLREIHNDKSIEIIIHDKMVVDYKNDHNCGQNKARPNVHKIISEKLRNISPTENKVVILDGVNFNTGGRSYWLSLIPKDVHICIVFFNYPQLILNGEFEKYVEWLHDIRKTHYCFPTDKEKAIKTMENLYNNFDDFTNDELSHEIIRLEPYYDTC
jgi:tRNA uridine 5-carbamoylmethylation protein Kti12